MFKSLLSPENPIIKLLSIATLLGGFLLFTTNSLFDTDGHLFVIYTEALAFGQSHIVPDAARYDIAYPFLLWLSGYPYHHSFIGITIINTIMAILMPLLVYYAVKPLFPKGAYYIALFFIASLVPFFYIKWIRPDHAYMFFTVLSISMLTQFIDTKRSVFLYAMALAVIAASLSRAAGNVFFPFFLCLAIFFGRGSWKHYAACLLIGLTAFSLYNYHRHYFFGPFGKQASSNGAQVFQNLYVNSKEFGIRLSPDLGPAMKTVTDNLYQALLPSPATSAYIKSEGNAASDEFLAKYIYPFSAEAFINQIFDVPSWDYCYLLYGATLDDPFFFKVSWEIVRQYPWYPFAYTARNMWHLFYDPGFAHTRYNVNPFGRTGIQDAFTFTNDSNEWDGLAARANREIQFDNLDHKFRFVAFLILGIKKIFCNYYLEITKVIFWLMAIAWITVGIELKQRFFPTKQLQRLVSAFPSKLTPIVIVITLYLCLSMLIISVFVDPMLRFHNHLLPFKLMLAGIGAGVLVQLITSFFMPSMIRINFNPSKTNAALTNQTNRSIIFLIILMIALFSIWSSYIVFHT